MMSAQAGTQVRMFSGGEQKNETQPQEKESQVEEPETHAETKTEEAVPKQDTPKEAGGGGGFLAIVAALGAVGAGVAIFGGSGGEESKPADTSKPTEQTPAATPAAEKAQGSTEKAKLEEMLQLQDKYFASRKDEPADRDDQHY